MIYLASPYTHKDPWVMEERYQRTMQSLSWLLAHKEWAYSPIVMCHRLANIAKLPVDHEFWLEFDHKMIETLPRFMILRIDGWETSKGVTIEKAFAESLGRRIEYL